MSEYYGVARSEEYLSHYGIKGMKWGVRKAQYYGDEKRLEKHYRKAARKLARLEKRGNNTLKYAARAAALGGAAGLAGSVAIGGTPLVSKVVNSAKRKNIDLMKKLGVKGISNAQMNYLTNYHSINKWGKTNSVHKDINRAINNFTNNSSNNLPLSAKEIVKKRYGPINTKVMESGKKIADARAAEKAAHHIKYMNENYLNKINDNMKDVYRTKIIPNSSKAQLENMRIPQSHGFGTHINNNPLADTKKMRAEMFNAKTTRMLNDVKENKAANLTNDQIIRLGAAGLTAGLLGAAGYNIYRAKTGAKNRAKAAQFRDAMNETFKGTKYEGMNGMPLPKKKRRR